MFGNSELMKGFHYMETETQSSPDRDSDFWSDKGP